MEIDKHLSHSLIYNYQLQVGIGRFSEKTSHNVRYFTKFFGDLELF